MKGADACVVPGSIRAEGALLNARTLTERHRSRSQQWAESHPAVTEVADRPTAASVLYELDELQKELRSALIGMDPKIN